MTDWSPHEDKLISDLIAAKMPYKQIADTLQYNMVGRTRGQIYNRIQILRRRAVMFAD